MLKDLPGDEFFSQARKMPAWGRLVAQMNAPTTAEQEAAETLQRHIWGQVRLHIDAEYMRNEVRLKESIIAAITDEVGGDRATGERIGLAVIERLIADFGVKD